MSDRIAVFVYARDPISQAGIAAQVRGRPEVRVVDNAEIDQAEVALVVADAIDEETARVMKGLQRNGCPRIVAVVTNLDDAGVLAALEAGDLIRRAFQGLVGSPEQADAESLSL